MSFFSNIFNKLFKKNVLLDKNYTDVKIATEVNGSFKFYSALGILILIVGIVISSQNLKTGYGLKTVVSGSTIGSKIFCGDKKLCPNGKCDNEVWRECSECPQGTAKAIMQIGCGNLIRSECTPYTNSCADR